MRDADPRALQARLLAASPDLDLSFRPMFGGIMAYSSGKPFASLSNVGLALKAAGGTRDALLALPGAEPLRYELDQPPSRTYVVIPPAVVEDDERLRYWAHRAAAGLPAAVAGQGKKGRTLTTS